MAPKAHSILSPSAAVRWAAVRWEVRAACIRKAAAEGTKEIQLFLQEHGVRSIFDLDPKFYPDLLKICDVKEDC